MGETGVGKSTFTHFVAGSKLKHGMQKSNHGGQISHIEVDKISEQCNSDELSQVEMSAMSESCTKHIIAINVTFKDQNFLICDSPGMGDTRGPEIDISNTYSLVKAAQ